VTQKREIRSREQKKEMGYPLAMIKKETGLPAI